MSEPAPVPEPAATQPGSTRTGPGRLLVAVYALFALSASARAGVQIATKFSHAPVAYVLSAFAGAVYILATVTLTVGSRTARRIAVLSCSIELAGVLTVGTWSLADRASFRTPRCGLATAAVTASSRWSFPFSACSGCAAGTGGPGPAERPLPQARTAPMSRPTAGPSAPTTGLGVAVDPGLAVVFVHPRAQELPQGPDPPREHTMLGG